MYKIIINYGGMTSAEDINKGMEIIVYHPNKSPDGTHISASSIFNANILKRLSKKQIDAFIDSLIPSIECCMKEVDRRINMEIIL